MQEDALAQQEYAQRLAVAELRRLVFEATDAHPPPDLLVALEASEKRLSELEDQTSGAGPEAESGGKIFDWKEAPSDARPQVRGAQTTGLEAEAQLRMAQVPTSIYHLLDSQDNPLVSGRVANLGRTTRRIRVISFLEGYSARAVDTFELPAKADACFYQLPTLFPDRLRDLHELTAASVNVLVEDLDGRVELHKTQQIPLLAKTTAPLRVRDPSSRGRWSDLTRYFGAFVTPNAPTVQSFLRKAVDSRRSRSLAGYQRSPEEVAADVKAVFDALKSSGVRYINSVFAFSPDEGTGTQRVRLPSESLTHRSANCIDGTVLVASLCEAMSVNPAIVLVPGHAFVAWETSPGNDDWRYLETTLIGSATFEEASHVAEERAQRYQRLRDETNKDSMFRQWPLRILRTTYRITPME